MSDPDNYEALLRKSFFGSFDTVNELWEDEISSSQVFQLGAITTITYTYLQQLPSYYGGRPETASGIFDPVASEPGLKSVIDTLLGNANAGYETLFGDVSNIVFLNIDNSINADNVGAMTFGQSDGTYEIGKPSAPAYTWASFQDNAELRQGDIWIRSNDPEHINPAPGSLGFVNIIHEMAHALGLEHPFDDGDSSAPHLDITENSLQYTVMSYNNHPGMHYDLLSNRDYHYSLQLYDIAALQEIYGRNYETRSADTVYDLGHGLGGKEDALQSTPFIYTIWDGGGRDIIDASGYHNYAAIIDLRQGAFSSIGDDGGSVRASENLAIAFHAVIEDARGTDIILDLQGRTGDILVGNAWDNDLFGGAGNDRIFGDGNAVTNDVIDMGVARGAGFHVGDSNRPGPESDPNNSGNDNIFGGSGADRMYGGRGLDYLNGGTENDQYFFDFSREQQFSLGTISFTIQSDGYDLIDETTGGGGFDTIKLENV